MNYSMFLMQRHNENEYHAFLKVLSTLKIHYICCCCKSIISDMLIMDEMVENTAKTIEINRRKPPDSVHDTRDLSVPEKHKQASCISVPTPVIDPKRTIMIGTGTPSTIYHKGQQSQRISVSTLNVSA